MEERQGPAEDPQPSRQETVSGAFPAGPTLGVSRPALDRVPGFPVRDWDRYEPLGFLGAGGMGMVFLAQDRRLGRKVALKFVRIENDRHLQRFMVEARAQAQVDHANVCKVFEVGEVEGRVFIAMQHIDGASLDVAAAGLSLEQKAIVLRDAALGVQAAHRVGIIHRDLKPSNIMVQRTEEGPLRTYVMDFGLAREWEQDVTETGSVLGTPAFMSPEQARGEVHQLDRRTDIYSLGAALYQVATGRLPVTGANPLEILSAIGSADIQPPRAVAADIPRDLEAITLKCLEKDRSRRYGSALALAADLDRFLAGEPVQARSTGRGYRLQRRLRKHWQLAAVVAVAGLAVLVALGVALQSRRELGRRERLARQFTESVARIESIARYSALSPLHDIRADLQTVRALMAQLRQDMRQAGVLADGPGHYALGWGHWIMDDREQAREHLQMAWDAGFREPRAAYALALALGAEYQERLVEAERIPAAAQRDARKREIAARLRDPALALLRQAEGPDAPSAAYRRALLAFYEGRVDEALAGLLALGADQPWFYEAPMLRGSLLQARAWARWNQGEREAAHADFEAGRMALAAAAASGRSAPAVHAALAGLELNALFMEKYGQGRVEPAYRRGIAAARTALAAQPDHPPALILQAALAGQYAESRMDRGERADDLVQQAVESATQAVAAGPARADARIALGKAYYLWGNARQEQNLDPREQLARGQQALESLSAEKRDYTVENHLGLIHQTWSDHEEQHGLDPAGHLDSAIAAYRRATRMEPRLLPAWINLGTCLQQRAALPRAAAPEDDLRAALEVLSQARSLNPKHFVPCFVEGKVRHDLAIRQRDRGEDPAAEFQRASEAYRRGLAINPRIPHLHNGLGLAQLHLARAAWDAGGAPGSGLGEAHAAFVQAVAVAPTQVFGYINLGDLLIWRARTEPGGRRFLDEAERRLRQGLKAAPGHRGPLANLGRLAAARIETGAGDPVQASASGEAVLARALATNPRDRDSLQYLGELRLAVANGKVQQKRALPGDFEQAEAPLRKALEEIPDSRETGLALARLLGLRASWERAQQRDPGPSLRQARTLLESLNRGRPGWAEPLAIQASLAAAEAEALPAEARAAKAAEAVDLFEQSFSRNRNLLGPWKAQADRVQKWARAGNPGPEPVSR